MDLTQRHRIVAHLSLNQSDEEWLSLHPEDFFSIHAANLPPQLSLLFKSCTNPSSRSNVHTVRRRRVNYANQVRPPQLTIDEARQRLPFLYAETLGLSQQDLAAEMTALGSHAIGRTSDKEAMDRRLDHILDVVEDEIVQERFKDQREEHQESQPETEDEEMELGQGKDEEKQLTAEEREDLEYENMLEFEKAVMELYLDGDPSLPSDFYDEIDFDDRWDMTEVNRAGWSREAEDRYFDQEEDS